VFRAFDIWPRRREPEIMDRPDLDRHLHEQALRGLERINFVSGSSALVWRPIRELALRHPNERLRILDLATGAGDIPIALWRRARRAGLPLNIEACDRSPHALAHAAERAQRQGADIRFFEWDAIRAPVPNAYDIVISSLFLHHLEPDDAVVVLKNMAAAARRLVLVNDLRRSSGGWWLAWIGTRLLSTSQVVHVDGPRSVAGAFTCREALDLACRAGLEGARIARRWPFRWLLTWSNPATESLPHAGNP
jgi:2-polyprenyl-3-methyl-5-hydroxy-6-metoxy-1,4-benzoquinol methylase